MADAADAAALVPAADTDSSASTREWTLRQRALAHCCGSAVAVLLAGTCFRPLNRDAQSRLVPMLSVLWFSSVFVDGLVKLGDAGELARAEAGLDMSAAPGDEHEATSFVEYGFAAADGSALLDASVSYTSQAPGTPAPPPAPEP